MRDLNDLMYFAAVVDHGGFTAASRELGIPKSKLSRRIALLESALDVRLLQRTTRKLSVTEVGKRFYTHCKAMLVEADAAETVVAQTHSEPCGSLHVSCPIGLLNMQVADLLAQFAIRYPLVNLQITATNRAVDVVAEGIDLALRVRSMPLQDSDLAVRVLSQSPQVLVASPALIESMSTASSPTLSPEDVAHWPSLGNGSAATKFVWPFTGSAPSNAAVQKEIAYMPRFSTTDMLTLHKAALAGVGIVQLPEAMVTSDLEQGSLQRVLPDWTLQAQTIHAVYASRRGLLSSVRALLDFLIDEFA